MTTGGRASGAVVRPARPEDLEAVIDHLRGVSLPTEGVAEWFDGFVIAEDGAAIVGAAGLEWYGPHVLLRSVVVVPAWRGRGVGHELVREVLEVATRMGAHAAFLLTTSAEDYFAAIGFTRIERDAVPIAVRASVEFERACPESASVMMRRLR